MSVICQNFVQNAWKKDLCSNCFKSVGDHENSEVITHNESLNSNQSENVNGRYISQAANVYPPHGNATPHTTWKTLISERNNKNSQPFKLENGFQGRLLTINKAPNGVEKKSIGESNLSNGHVPNSDTTANGDSPKSTNASEKKFATKSDNSLQKNSQPRNGLRVRNGFGCGKKTQNMNCNGFDKNKTGNESKNEKDSCTKQNVPVNKEQRPEPSNEKHSQPRFIKNKIEETQPAQSRSIHGILKKTVTAPERGTNQTRRGINVGFKDEEPMVIGYGGRDFTPEELEWDMASSDGESENSSDALDETEEDRAFSKMTKENTEFNSDNDNLIQKCKDNGDNKTDKKRDNGKIVYKTEAKILKSTSPAITESQTTEKIISSESSPHNGNETIVNELSVNRNENEITCDEIHDEGKIVKNGNFGEVTIKSSETNSKKIAPTASKDKSHSINVAVKSDKMSHVAAASNVTVVKTAEAVDSKREVKNSMAFVNGAKSPPPADDAENIGSEKETERSEEPLMFSDGGEHSSQPESIQEAENSVWPDRDGLAGEILQAINTSLTNRHKMKNTQSLDDSVEMHVDVCAPLPPVPENTTAENEKNGNMDTVNDDNEIDNTCDVGKARKEIPGEEGPVETALNVQPRTSFLHGIVSNSRISKPSAIYGPASDLFVSRSNSSSSSSSDEYTKNETSHLVNVTINGECNAANDIVEMESPATTASDNCSAQNSASAITVNKTKPKIPAKPLKQFSGSQPNPSEDKTNLDNKELLVEKGKTDIYAEDNVYYSPANNSVNSNGPTSIALVDHYAESNIYHEVENKDSPIPECEQPRRNAPGRESKLAALAVELEQVRHSNGNTKRQAPAPPKVPDPPLENPPSCSGRASPPIPDAPHGFSSFRGEAMAFSSASSTTSTSSQDTETGYASWNLNGDEDATTKYSKSKGSFLLTQYSKCKMLAMGYAEDSAKARKRFSLKKLLKRNKDSEMQAAFDPRHPNPKAWKYSDQFERPRAKLEIIHPMDLENKSVTVNPGFDSLNSGSMSSFTASADDLSFRNSVSSDYGSYYSDTMSPPVQEFKGEANYEYIHPILPEQEEVEGTNDPSRSTSPTPSRSSVASQGSTLTSGSSKNGVSSPHRPPKPPPPPRAHSLLPGNKILRNPDGTFKFPVASDDDTGSESAVTSSAKPQAPKRQCKSVVLRTDYTNYGDKNESSGESASCAEDTESIVLDHRNTDFAANNYESITNIRVGSPESIYQDTCVKGEIDDIESNNASTSSQVDITGSSLQMSTDEACAQDTVSLVIKNVQIGDSTTASKLQTESQPTQGMAKFVKNEKTSKSTLSRNKHPPFTKSPTRPPPIYSKPLTGVAAKNLNPWKTLEDSYLTLTATNRELLIKLINQSLRRRKDFLSEIQKVQFQWSDFEIDISQPSSVFAFGEKIAYHATMPKYPEYCVTLVVTVQQHHIRINENNELKYPVFGQFADSIPSELLDYSSDRELESMQATILVLDRSTVSTIECFIDSLPACLTEENEKELCFIVLQLIHSLKSLQAQGIESMDSSFQNLILAKSKQDKYNTLVFLSDNCYDENDYGSDSCKISLCQYALMLLFQILEIRSIKEFVPKSVTKFSSQMARKVFETAISLLSEEKAVSLSQTKALFECFLWGVIKVIESFDEADDTDCMLHRWLDIERANYIKNVINDERSYDINIQNEYYSQFLIRTSVRNIKEVVSYL